MKIKFLPESNPTVKVKNQPVGEVIKVGSETYTGVYLILSQKVDTQGDYIDAWDFDNKVVTQIHGEYVSIKLECTLTIGE